MIAVADLIPSDPDEQRTVRSILDANPQVRGFIVRASAKAEELFPGATIRLDAVQYDEWDPPLQLVILIPLSWDDSIQQREIYLAWISAQLDLDLILPLPVWNGPTDGLH